MPPGTPETPEPSRRPGDLEDLPTSVLKALRGSRVKLIQALVHECHVTIQVSRHDAQELIRLQTTGGPRFLGSDE